MEIGSYRGFTMMLSYDSFDNAYQLSLNGEMHHHVTLGTDARGNLTRIYNVLAGIEGRIETTKQKLESLYQQQEDARAELGKPFPQEAELQEQSARLAELDAALNMDEHESAGVIGECVQLDLKDIRNFTEQISRIGNNLNQHAKVANVTGSIYAQDIAYLREQFAVLCEMEADILAILSGIR